MALSKDIMQQMTEASYQANPPQRIGEFTLAFSNPTLKFYKSDNDKTIVVSIRGTQTKDDVKTWHLVGLNKLKTSKRYKDDLKTLTEFQIDYPPALYNYVGVGHSLGGALLDLFLRAGLIKRGVSYNPAVEPKNFKAGLQNERIYRSDDPLYATMGRFVPGVEVRKAPKKRGFLRTLAKYNPFLVTGAIGRAAFGAKDYLEGHNLSNFKGGAFGGADPPSHYLNPWVRYYDNRHISSFDFFRLVKEFEKGVPPEIDRLFTNLLLNMEISFVHRETAQELIDGGEPDDEEAIISMEAAERADAKIQDILAQLRRQPIFRWLQQRRRGLPYRRPEFFDFLTGQPYGGAIVPDFLSDFCDTLHTNYKKIEKAGGKMKCTRKSKGRETPEAAHKRHAANITAAKKAAANLAGRQRLHRWGYVCYPHWARRNAIRTLQKEGHTFGDADVDDALINQLASAAVGKLYKQHEDEMATRNRSVQECRNILVNDLQTWSTEGDEYPKYGRLSFLGERPNRIDIRS